MGPNFLEELFQQGLINSAANTTQSALSMLVRIGNRSFGQHQLVVRFMKGLFNLRPALAKHNVARDVTLLLKYLKNRQSDDLK